MTDILFIAENTSAHNAIANELRQVTKRIKKRSLDAFLNTARISAKAVFCPVYRAQINTKEFSQLVDKILARFNRRGSLYFRFYLYPIDFAPSLFTAMIDDQNNEALERLADVVHMSPVSLDELKKQIDVFLKTRGEMRRFFNYRTAEAVMKVILGASAKCISIAALLLTVLFGINNMYSLPAFVAPFYEMISRFEWFHDAILAACGILLSSAFYFLNFRLRTNRAGHAKKEDGTRIIERNRDMLYVLLIFLKAFLGCYVFYQIAGYDIILFLWYLVFGCIINATGRQYYQGKRFLRLKAMRAEEHTPQGKSLPKSLTQGDRSQIHRFRRLPVFSSGTNNPRVFCSYTHSSSWAKEMVQKVYDELSLYGFDCFVDKYGIAPGSSWRHQLRLSMADADYVICFCDKSSIQKPWPASELETALRVRDTASSLFIVCVTPQDFDDKDCINKMPVFERLFVNEGEPQRFVKLSRESGNMISYLARHSIVLQEDYLDRSLTANFQGFLWPAFVVWKLSGLFFPRLLKAAAWISGVAAILFFAVQAVNDHTVTSSFTLLREVLFGNPGSRLWHLCACGGIMICCAVFLDELYAHIVTRPVEPEKKNLLLNGLFKVLMMSVCVLFILLFFTSQLHVSILSAVILFSAGFYACCGIDLHYTSEIDMGTHVQRNRIPPERLTQGLHDATERPQPAMFRIEQQYQLAGRSIALRSLYKFFNTHKKNNDNPLVWSNTRINGIKRFGTGIDNPDLWDSYHRLIKVKNNLLKCGHSHNLGTVFDDLADVTACLGRFKEAITYYGQKCQFFYASFYSDYKSYSEIYETCYRMAWLAYLDNDFVSAEKYAYLALQGIVQNDRLKHDHLKDIWRNARGKKLIVVWHTVFDRSLTIGFKQLCTDNEKLFEEIKRFWIKIKRERMSKQ
jgi:hypothetical protein